MRWGLGPVFIYECAVNSRRWQTYVLRSAGVAALLVAMGLIAMAGTLRSGNKWRDYANLGQAYFIAMIGVELALVILAGPAATAGAICVDRASGTLAHMLMTDLSDPEIVLGKLAARLLPVFGLVACTWPVMAISSVLGGIDPIALSLAFAIIVAVAVLGCTIALAFSVWARKSHEVILATYTVFIAGLVLWPTWFLLWGKGPVGRPPQWALLANPFYVAFAPYTDPAKLDFWDYLLFFGVVLLASALLTGLTVWRMRPVACRGSVEKSHGQRVGLIGRITRWLPGPSLDHNPVLWREWHRSRNSRWMTAILALLMGTTGALTLVAAVVFWKNGLRFPRASAWETAGTCASVLHVIFGLLMLAAIAPTSMAEERQRGSLDLLSATALSTRAIVIGKWLGTYRLVLLMIICPGLMALAMATTRVKSTFTLPPGMHPDYTRMIPPGARICGVIVVIATILAHGALISSIGVALGVWIKRQSRAIAISVGFFLLVSAAWPIVAWIVDRIGPGFGQGLANLSSVVVCIDFIAFFRARTYGFVQGQLWSSTFWAVEVLALAMGLLWITVRTFDGCFDRIPDRPRRRSLLKVVVIILAGMIGVGSLSGALESWIEGVKPGAMSGPSALGVLDYVLVIAIGMVLVAVDSAKLPRKTWTTVPNALVAVDARSGVCRQWWESFRLILLLAIGPALIGTALATAVKSPQYEPQFTTNAAGITSITSYALKQSDILDASELRLGERLMVAALLVVTVLVHGGAGISVGLGLIVAQGWSKLALAAAVGLSLIAVFMLPLYLLMVHGGPVPGLGMWSFVIASNSLLSLLVTRSVLVVRETLWSVIVWDIVVAFFAVALAWTAIWVTQHRSSDLSKSKPSLAGDFPAD